MFHTVGNAARWEGGGSVAYLSMHLSIEGVALPVAANHAARLVQMLAVGEGAAAKHNWSAFDFAAHRVSYRHAPSRQRTATLSNFKDLGIQWRAYIAG